MKFNRTESIKFEIDKVTKTIMERTATFIANNSDDKDWYQKIDKDRQKMLLSLYGLLDHWSQKDNSYDWKHAKGKTKKTISTSNRLK